MGGVRLGGKPFMVAGTTKVLVCKSSIVEASAVLTAAV